jgi:hypothetical protein
MMVQGIARDGGRRFRTGPPDKPKKWCARGELNPYALSGTRT